MLLRSCTDEDRKDRESIATRVEACRTQGECPTCVDLVGGGVYPDRTRRTFFETDTSICMLEQYLRNPGHTIVLPKLHREDISELPASELESVYMVINSCVTVLKSVLGAEKIYLCTMCDGERNHLHYQLIPRYRGDRVRGSVLFVAERRVLADDEGHLRWLREAMNTTVGHVE